MLGTIISICYLSLTGLSLISQTDGLSCYACSQTGGQSAGEANIKCLDTSGELTCAKEEDRCYSLTSGQDVKEVQKNCARSTACVGRICCDSDFCNAGYGITSQRGVGKVCDSPRDCVQGGGDMYCDVEQSTNGSKICRCTDSVATFGPICRKALINERCFTDVQCNDPNAHCLNGRCTCRLSFFTNQTFCEIKRPLGEACTVDQQCQLSNSVCDGIRCVCQFGFLFSNNTNTCSDCVSTGQGHGITLILTTAFIAYYLALYSSI